MKIKNILAALALTVTASFGASTLNISNFSSTTVGLPVVTSTGSAAAVGTYYANPGFFTTTINWSTATASSILAAFTSIDASPLTGTTRTGLFTGQTFNGSLPVGFAGTPAYVVIADNSNFSLATKVAVYSAGVNFTAPDGAGNSAQSIALVDSTKIVFGTLTPVTTQPSNLSGANFSSGVQLIAAAVPETSTSLLGALGALALLRRRRN